MPRPLSSRTISNAIHPCGFCPTEDAETHRFPVFLTLDEAEALRLADLRGLYQEAAASRMGVSRQTFGRIVASARRKTAGAILQGRQLVIQGGSVAVSDKQGGRSLIAVAAAGGMVAESFRNAEKLLVFGQDGVLDSEITTIRPGDGAVCGAEIARVMASKGVTRIVTGFIGSRAVRLLRAYGISTQRGVSGPAQEAVRTVTTMEGSMKLAVVSDDGLTISQHFGRAPTYVVLTVSDGKITEREERQKISHHHEHGHHNGVHGCTCGNGSHEEHAHHGDTAVKRDHHAEMAAAIVDCSVLLAGGMGPGARENMMQSGITPIVTDIRDIESAAEAYLAGTLHTS